MDVQIVHGFLPVELRSRSRFMPLSRLKFTQYDLQLFFSLYEVRMLL